MSGSSGNLTAETQQWIICLMAQIQKSSLQQMPLKNVYLMELSTHGVNAALPADVKLWVINAFAGKVAIPLIDSVS